MENEQETKVPEQNSCFVSCVPLPFGLEGGTVVVFCNCKRCGPDGTENQWPLDVRYNGELPEDLEGWTIILAQCNGFEDESEEKAALEEIKKMIDERNGSSKEALEEPSAIRSNNWVCSPTYSHPNPDKKNCMYVSKILKGHSGYTEFQICACEEGCDMEGGQTGLPDRLFDADTYVPSWASIRVLKGNGFTKEEDEKKAYEEFDKACEPRRQLIENR
jgi:hypothetical protein